MKRLFLPLLAALALPTAVNAESYWLILNYHSGQKFLLNHLSNAKNKAKYLEVEKDLKNMQCIIGV